MLTILQSDTRDFASSYEPQWVIVTEAWKEVADGQGRIAAKVMEVSKLC